MSSNYESSDDDDVECEESQFNETEYLKLLKEHKKKRRMKVVRNGSCTCTQLHIHVHV